MEGLLKAVLAATTKHDPFRQGRAHVEKHPAYLLVLVIIHELQLKLVWHDEVVKGMGGKYEVDGNLDADTHPQTLNVSSKIGSMSTFLHELRHACDFRSRPLRHVALGVEPMASLLYQAFDYVDHKLDKNLALYKDMPPSRRLLLSNHMMQYCLAASEIVAYHYDHLLAQYCHHTFLNPTYCEDNIKDYTERRKTYKKSMEQYLLRAEYKWVVDKTEAALKALARIKLAPPPSTPIPHWRANTRRPPTPRRRSTNSKKKRKSRA